MAVQGPGHMAYIIRCQVSGVREALADCHTLSSLNFLLIPPYPETRLRGRSRCGAAKARNLNLMLMPSSGSRLWLIKIYSKDAGYG
jgi:hypothetical protein